MGTDWLHSVMAGLVPAIHAFHAAQRMWMPGPSPGMTTSAKLKCDCPAQAGEGAHLPRCDT
ncbi:hypothetical protein ABH994_007066 [Bradyrhizobium yuanmingense]|uniref:Uncharacterized protein n=1 Tax=Bradyrhizobium yuanmingense TaxID=108015 RepID=A0ABV4GI15_9BRAD